MISYCEKTDNYGLVWRIPPVIEFNEKKMQINCGLCNTQPSREKGQNKEIMKLIMKTHQLFNLIIRLIQPYTNCIY